MIRVYTYAKCETCRKAVKFLEARRVAFENLPIRDTPPSIKELKTMLGAYGGSIRKLFNTSGRDYKAMGLGAKLEGLSEAEALGLLAGNGNLIKRPFLIGDGACLVGFQEREWEKALSSGQ